MVMEIGLLRALTEKMIALPFECALQTAQYVMTLGADGFINFITANMLETGIMMLKRIAIDPIKYRLIRVVKLRLKVQAAQRSGTAVPISTPEIEVRNFASVSMLPSHPFLTSRCAANDRRSVS